MKPVLITILLTLGLQASYNDNMCKYYNNKAQEVVELANNTTEEMRKMYLHSAVEYNIKAKYKCGKSNEHIFEDRIEQIKSVI